MSSNANRNESIAVNIPPTIISQSKTSKRKKKQKKKQLTPIHKNPNSITFEQKNTSKTNSYTVKGRRNTLRKKIKEKKENRNSSSISQYKLLKKELNSLKDKPPLKRKTRKSALSRSFTVKGGYKRKNKKKKHIKEIKI
jgi:hypothetical protein